MAIWFVMIITGCIAVVLNAFFSVSKSHSNLPPGPRRVSTLRKVTEMEKILRDLYSKYGKIISLQHGSSPMVFISDGTLAHQALIQQGAVFADRPQLPLTEQIMSSNQHTIITAQYGPTWRIMRRNLTSHILHPSKYKEFAIARKWTLEVLLSRLRRGIIVGNGSGVVKVFDDARFAVFCLSVFMCFGDKMDETSIEGIDKVLQPTLLSYGRRQILNIWPWMTRVLLRSRWNEFLNMKKNMDDVLTPYIRARKEVRGLNGKATCYLDTLFELELPKDRDLKRKLSEEEILIACSEMLSAGVDTTATALQWIMANLVKYPDIQAKLFKEIKGIVGEEAKEVEEDDLSKMPYLKAVVLEGLRRHPPIHFMFPHVASQDVEVGGYTVPKNAVVNFSVAEMSWDPEVWDDPMEFKPERFMTRKDSVVQEDFDITGSREIKMMPFGAGRRICPGASLSLLHLEYFVSNLVWKFEWKVADGQEVDLAEQDEVTTVMKYPLHAHISPR